MPKMPSLLVPLCINDVSGLSDPNMAASVAEHDGSLIIMASRQRAGDLLHINEIIAIAGRESEGRGPERSMPDEDLS